MVMVGCYYSDEVVSDLYPAEHHGQLRSAARPPRAMHGSPTQHSPRCSRRKEGAQAQESAPCDRSSKHSNQLGCHQKTKTILLCSLSWVKNPL